MALLAFTVILLLLLVAERLLLTPLHWLVAFHLPAWAGLVIGVAVLSWLIGE